MLPFQKKRTASFYALLSLPATAMGFALSIQISALSWILSTQYGLEVHDVGLVWAAGPIAGILGQVIVGVISDNVWFMQGRRRPFIVIGGVLAALMLLALPNIGVLSTALGMDGILGVAILVALTLDLAINVSFNPTRSIIADVTPEGQARTKGYTWMQTISGTFGVLAYVIGALFDKYFLIYFGVGLVLVFSLIPPLFVEEPRHLGRPEDTDGGVDVSSASLREILRSIMPLWGFLAYGIYGMVKRLAGFETDTYFVEALCLGATLALIARTLMQRETGLSKVERGRRGFQKVLAAHAFTWVGVQTMFVYMFAYLQFRLPELSDESAGRVLDISFLILNAVAAILPVLLLEPLCQRFGRVRVHTACMAIMALGYGGVWWLGASPFVIYLLMAVLGVGWAATVSLPFAIMSQKVDQARMGLYMGLFNLSVVLPQLVASLGVGEWVSQAADKRLIFIICTLTLAFSALCWSLVREEPVDEAEDLVVGTAH